MSTVADRVRDAAFFRWQTRGCYHGAHVSDWLAAEQAVAFNDAYKVAAAYIFDGRHYPPVDSGRRGVCRFCEQAAPRTRFRGPNLAYPAGLGNGGLTALDHCDECRTHFEESLEPALDAYLSFWSEDPDSARRIASIPVGAYKSLIHAALSLMPARLLEMCPDILEWVNNADHDLDGIDLERYGPLVHRLDRASPCNWAAVMRKRDRDAAVPSLVAFFGLDRQTLQVPIPHCLGDDDLDGMSIEMPMVGHALDPLHGPSAFESTRLHVAPCRPKRGWLPANADHIGVS